MPPILADRYRLERELGAGGMAVVYLAEDLKHGRKVAVKVLRPEIAGSLGADRFLREIAIAGRMSHPNIVGLLDSGEDAGTLFYVMPHVAGGSLRARLSKEGELPVADAIRILREAVDALRYAHGQGIVHRDIKPENVLFADSHPQLADFGIARAVSAAATDTRLTGTGITVGTPAYMAPEQAAGDPNVDHRADLYAIGLLGYEMLTGAHPFGSLPPLQQIAAQVTRAIDSPDRLRPAVPARLAAIVTRCLEKRPADRWQSADELLRELDGLLAAGPSDPRIRVEAELVSRAFRLSEDLCLQLDRRAFDPRMIGGSIAFRDNGRASNVLVCFLSRWSTDPEDGDSFLRATQYRAVAPALFGFDPARRYHISLPVDDHLVLIGALVEELRRTSGARHVVVVGFSTGADLAQRMAGIPPSPRVPGIDGCLALGGNLSPETCFLSGVLDRAITESEAQLVAYLQEATRGAATLQEWLAITDYLGKLVRRFRTDLHTLRDFAREIAGPFDAGRLVPFVRWYRAGVEQGRRLRCVFEDNPLYRELVRELQLRNRDEGLLGAAYQEGSIVIEPGTDHFDLEKPDLIERHLDALVDDLRVS
jgi:serine/threonine protein kinase